MTYITFTHVDAITGLPVTQEPARGGPTFPAGAQFGFALESQYPTATPTFYGTTDGDPDDPGILSIISKAEYDAAYEAEMEARKPPPVVLTVGELVGRFIIPDEDDAFASLDDAMMVESRLVKRNWLNSVYSFTEGDGFWLIVAGHLDAIVTSDRKAELLGRSSSASVARADLLAA